VIDITAKPLTLQNYLRALRCFAVFVEMIDMRENFKLHSFGLSFFSFFYTHFVSFVADPEEKVL
jgi:hypothetical protein